ncbi:MAG TPA: PAN domain-containing protein [Alphaproteobacteria bacterium]|jgi:hypothetical protein
MIGFRIALIAALCCAAGTAGAQGARNSSFYPNSSMTFRSYIEPFPTFSNAAACRHACVADGRCSGWTWYDGNPRHPAQLRRVCIMGTTLKDGVIGRAPARTAGLVTPGGRRSSVQPNSSHTFHQYLEPFPSADTAELCRDACVADVRCAGWTWYENDASHPQQLRRVCIMGAGLKDSVIGTAPNRSAGLVTLQ